MMNMGISSMYNWLQNAYQLNKELNLVSHWDISDLKKKKKESRRKMTAKVKLKATS